MMKEPCLNATELQLWIEHFYQNLLGAQLQGVYYYGSYFIFEFYNLKSIYLTLTTAKDRPALGMLAEKSQWSKGQKKQTPVQLYLQAHFRGQYLKDWGLTGPGERQLIFQFAKGHVVFQLIPHRFNLWVKLDGAERALYYLKPMELPAQSSSQAGANKAPQLWPVREALVQDLHQGQGLFFYHHFFAPKTAAVTAKASLACDRRSLQLKDLAKLKEQWEQVSWQLQQPELAPEAKSLLYIKQKKWETKIARLEARLSEAALEVTSAHPKQAPSFLVAKARVSARMQQADIQGRLYEVDGFILSIGKNGVENLKLLRTAKPWEIWLHVKTGAGPHMILHCEKHRPPSDQTLQKAARILVEYQTRQRKMGGTFEVVSTQVRFVRPIKGAKPGLVTYHQTQTWRIYL